MEIFQNLGFQQEEQERKVDPGKDVSLILIKKKARVGLSYRQWKYFTWGSIVKGIVSVSNLGRQ